MSFFECSNMRAVTSGRWIARSDDAPIVDGVGIDTREDLLSKAFVAIEGQNHDGHDFLVHAVESGAGMLVVREGSIGKDCTFDVPVLEVEDTRMALGRLAAAYRKTLTGTRIIAVTGSSGKTTTKRMIDAVLSQSLRGRAAPKSFNNDIGVPLTVLSASPRDQYLVVEIGANAPGEIAALARIASPDIAVITNVGRAHLDGFGSVEAVAREKSSLLNHVTDGGLSVIFADSPLLREHARLATSAVFFGETDQADLRLVERGRNDGLWWFEINDRARFTLSLAGRHNALNALAAIAVARRFNLDDDTINTGLVSVQPESMRLSPQDCGSIHIINDAYNANPESMIAAIDAFIEMTKDATRRVVLLGDMLELGNDTDDLHAMLGRYLVQVDRQSPIDAVIAVGPAMTSLVDIVRACARPDLSILHAVEPDGDAIEGAIRQAIRPGDAVLVKASRGIALERAIAHIEHIGTAASDAESPAGSGQLSVAGP